MTDFQVFQSERFGKIRTVSIDGVPWFVGKDVAEALGYAKSENALARHVADEDKNTTPIQGGNRGNPNMVIINERGLYSLILSSKLPAAKEFKRWVTSEVLPAIRKTGEYSLIPVTLPPEVEQRGLTTDDYLRAAAIVSACKNDRLPYVLGFLEQGGFSIPQLKSSGTGTLNGKTGLSLSQLLRKAQGCGVSLRQLEKLTGIQAAQLYRYKSGQKPHSPARVEYLIHIIEGAISEAESAESAIEAEYQPITEQ